MSMEDIAARMKAAKKKKDIKKGASQAPFDPAESYRLRAKMLGVLIRDARSHADRSVDDCARLLEISPQTFESWEYGDSFPSLPQLELLAAYLDVPVSHFWGMKTLSKGESTRRSSQAAFIALRQRMIGALMRQYREEAGLDLDALSAETHLSAATLAAYELGEQPIPVHELAVIAAALKQSMNVFMEADSQIGEMLANLQAWQHFNDLPPDLRAFAANPLNIGFIEIALAFSQMENERLKRIAVSMLDITGY